MREEVGGSWFRCPLTSNRALLKDKSQTAREERARGILPLSPRATDKRGRVGEVEKGDSLGDKGGGEGLRKEERQERAGGLGSFPDSYSALMTGLTASTC